MIVLISALCGLSLFGVLTQRTWIGIVINLHLLFVAVVLALVGLDPAPSPRSAGVAVTMLIFGNLQSLLAFGFVVRLHYQGLEPKMTRLQEMRN
jgi:NADH:ubiquinone oxidoreductase subunit K